MSFRWPLLNRTDPKWVDCVANNFHAFLNDHAANERKAAASAMALVVQYPNHLSLVKTAISIAQEELHHLQLVFDRMCEEGAPLLPDEKDSYVRKLLSQVRSGGEERLLDRLLVNSVVEWRGMERFELLAINFPSESWRKFYASLLESEARHGNAFKREAEKIFPKDVVDLRWEEFLELEAEALRKNPITHRFH